MNYVFLDLEWDNSYSRKQKKNINEIIEIGAVKLNEAFEEVSRFDCFIRSQLSKKLGKRFRTLTNISDTEMREGVLFRDAINNFQEWLGEENLIITWSNSDLYAIADNVFSFLPDMKIDFFGNYLDLQKFYQSVFPETGKNQIGLKPAAEALGISLEELSLHRASDDSALCAEIFRRIYKRGSYEDLIVDTTAPKFFERLYFRPFIVNDISSEYMKQEYFIFKCPKCGALNEPTGEWRLNNNQFYGDFKCQLCNKKFTGRLLVKRYYDQTKVRKVTLTKSKKAPRVNAVRAKGEAPLGGHKD